MKTATTTEPTRPARSARIVRLWDIPRDRNRLFSYPVVGIRKCRDGYEVARGECRFGGRNSVLNGWTWESVLAVCPTQEEAEREVETRFPTRRNAMQDLEDVRAQRRA